MWGRRVAAFAAAATAAAGAASCAAVSVSPPGHVADAVVSRPSRQSWRDASSSSVVRRPRFAAASSTSSSTFAPASSTSAAAARALLLLRLGRGGRMSAAAAESSGGLSSDGDDEEDVGGRVGGGGGSGGSGGGGTGAGGADYVDAALRYGVAAVSGGGGEEEERWRGVMRYLDVPLLAPASWALWRAVILENESPIGLPKSGKVTSATLQLVRSAATVNRVRADIVATRAQEPRTRRVLQRLESVLNRMAGAGAGAGAGAAAKGGAGGGVPVERLKEMDAVVHAARDLRQRYALTVGEVSAPVAERMARAAERARLEEVHHLAAQAYVALFHPRGFDALVEAGWATVGSAPSGGHDVVIKLLHEVWMGDMKRLLNQVEGVDAAVDEGVRIDAWSFLTDYNYLRSPEEREVVQAWGGYKSRFALLRLMSFGSFIAYAVGSFRRATWLPRAQQVMLGVTGLYALNWLARPSTTIEQIPGNCPGRDVFFAVRQRLAASSSGTVGGGDGGAGAGGEGSGGAESSPAVVALPVLSREHLHPELIFRPHPAERKQQLEQRQQQHQQQQNDRQGPPTEFIDPDEDLDSSSPSGSAPGSEDVTSYRALDGETRPYVGGNDDADEDQQGGGHHLTDFDRRDEDHDYDHPQDERGAWSSSGYTDSGDDDDRYRVEADADPYYSSGGTGTDDARSTAGWRQGPWTAGGGTGASQGSEDATPAQVPEQVSEEAAHERRRRLLAQRARGGRG